MEFMSVTLATSQFPIGGLQLPNMAFRCALKRLPMSVTAEVSQSSIGPNVASIVVLSPPPVNDGVAGKRVWPQVWPHRIVQRYEEEDQHEDQGEEEDGSTY
jgi:hypothetical protein